MFTTKNWKCLDKKFWYFFHISAQAIECGYLLEPPRWGGSNEYPQSMFLSRKKNNVYSAPVNPSFTIQKWGLRGSKLYRHVSWCIVCVSNVVTLPLCLAIVCSSSLHPKVPWEDCASWLWPFLENCIPRIYPKYWDSLSTFHTCPTIFSPSFGTPFHLPYLT